MRRIARGKRTKAVKAIDTSAGGRFSGTLNLCWKYEMGGETKTLVNVNGMFLESYYHWQDS